MIPEPAMYLRRPWPAPFNRRRHKGRAHMSDDLLGLDGDGRPLDVQAFMDSGCPQLIATILDLGCLVSLGTTRDGGAVSITITHDGAYSRSYFRASEDAVEWLERATGVLRARGLTERRGEAPSVPLARRRRQKLA
jgi:hypothetical protein